MTVWWGLAGLLGLLGCCGLLRSHRADGTADDDPLARYPAAREPATPNADTAHTPLMTPAVTPEMLARPAPPAPPRRVSAVPESGTIAGEIPGPRPGTAEPDASPAPDFRRAGAVVPAGVEARPGPGAPMSAAPMPAAQGRPESVSRSARAPEEEPKHARRPTEREAVPQQEETQARQPRAAAPAEERPEPASRQEKPAEPPARPSRGSMVWRLVGKAKRLLRRSRE
jgi:hypothetical protein